MIHARRIGAIAATIAVTAALSACSMIQGPKQAACDALYEKIDGVAAQFSAQTGGPELSVQDLEKFITELEQQNPEAAEKVREGNFSGLLEGSGVNIEQLEAATGNSQLSELVTPENLAALDGLGSSLMQSLDQVQSLCGS